MRVLAVKNHSKMNQKYIQEIDQDIAHQEQNILRANDAIKLLKATKFLLTIEDSAMTPVDHYLQEHYQATEVKAFRADEISHALNWTSAYILTVIKRAISRYKSTSGLKTNPTWAKEAIKAAKLYESAYYPNESK